MKKRILSFLLVLVLVFSSLALTVSAVAASGSAEAQAASAEEMAEETDKLTVEEYCQKYGIGLNTSAKYKLTAAQLKAAVEAAGGTVILNTEFDADDRASTGKISDFAGTTGLSKNDGSASRAFDSIVTKKDEKNNYYLNFASPLYAIDSNGKLYNTKKNDDGTYADEDLQDKVNSGAVYVENGVAYYNGTQAGDRISAGEYLQWAGTALTAKDYASNPDRVGDSYTLSLSMRFNGTIYSTAGGCLDAIRSQTSYGTTTENKEFDRTSASYNFGIDETGRLHIIGAGEKNYTPTEYYLTADEWTVISVHHTPRGLDGVRGNSDDNTAHFYVNGKHVATVKAVSDAETMEWTTTINSKQVTINSALDFTVSNVRFGQYRTGFDVDDLRLYRGKFVEEAPAEHKWTYSHEHDMENRVNVLTARCTECGKVETANAPLTEYIGDYNLTKTEIAERFAKELRELRKNTSFDTKNNPFDVISKTSRSYTASNGFVVDWSIIDTVSDNYGTKYAKYHAPIAYDSNGVLITEEQAAQNGLLLGEGEEFSTENADKCIKFIDGIPYYFGAFSGEYLQMDSGIYDGNVKADPENEFIGADYVFTFDFMHYGNTDVTPISHIRSLLGVDFANVNVTPIEICADGSLMVKPNGSTFEDTGVDIPKNKFVQISIMHKPSENKLYVFVDGKLAGVGTAVSSATNWIYKNTDNKDYEYNTATDFTLRMIRFAQPSSISGGDLFAIDDARFYYGSLAECKHSVDAFAGKCVWCGTEFDTCVCELCGGHPISEGAVITGRNIALGENLLFNAYLTLSEEIKSDANSKLIISTTADGGVSECEYTVSELVPDADGKYKITVPVRSIDIMKEISVSIEADCENIPVPYTTSAYDYLNDLYDTDYAYPTRNLIKSILNYGAYAQLYFAALHGDSTLADNLPNEELLEYDKNAVDRIDASNLKDYEIEISGKGIKELSASLVLEALTSMNIYFEADSATTVTIETEDGAKELPVTKGSTAGEYVVTITEATPELMANTYALTFTNADGVTTVRVSVFSALYAVVESESASEEFKDLAKATYLYSTAAKEYNDMLNGITTGQKWNDDGVLKILFIGNSFSQDAMKHMHDIALNLGFEHDEIIIANLYIGGCYIDKHIDKIEGEIAEYTYEYFDENGVIRRIPDSLASDYIASENWDIISMQQASKQSFLNEKYVNLPVLIDLVKTYCPRAKLVWHMTWAYENQYALNSDYGITQESMYSGILNAVNTCVLTNENISMVIPSGTAIQNARTSVINIYDTENKNFELTRDGYHLSEKYGRFIAGVSAFGAIMQYLDIDDVYDIANLTWAPEGVTDTERAVVIESVQNALANPYEITQSAYPKN